MLKGLLLVLIVAMIGTVSWQVFSRYALQSPSSATEEIARFQLIWLGLLGAVYTFRQKMHVSIDALVSPLTGKARTGAELFSLLATSVFVGAVLIYGGIRLVILTETLNQTSAALGWPISTVYSIIPISGALILVYALHFARHAHEHEDHFEDRPPQERTPQP